MADLTGNIWVPRGVDDPERFGTVLRYDKTWTLVAPFNAKMMERAKSLGAVDETEQW